MTSFFDELRIGADGMVSRGNRSIHQRAGSLRSIMLRTLIEAGPRGVMNAAMSDRLDRPMHDIWVMYTQVNRDLSELGLEIRSIIRGVHALVELDDGALAAARSAALKRANEASRAWKAENPDRVPVRRPVAAVKLPAAPVQPTQPIQPVQRAPYTRETLDRMRRGENAAQLGWTKYEYDRIAHKHGIEPLLMPVAEAAE